MRRNGLLLLLVPLALAACGGGGKKAATTTAASAMSAVEAAAVKTVAAGSEHLALKVTGQASGQQVVVTGSGAFDSKRQQGSLNASLAAGSITTAIDEVLSGTQIYLESPLLSAALPKGKKWIRLDLTKLASQAGLGLLAQQDPLQALRFLRSLKSATLVGKEQIGAVSTTHYRVSLDASKLPQPAASQLGKSSYDVWVGTDGYVHRVRFVSPGPPKVAAVSDLSDFGSPVHVTVPSAAESFSTDKIPGLGG